MSKKLLVIPILVVVLTMLLAVTGWACGSCDCGCDCDCHHDCSPGFWKNHTEIWYADFGGDTGAAFGMLAALKAKGNDPLFADRFTVADTLNEAYPDAPCD
jgi:hypothetical protein